MEKNECRSKTDSNQENVTKLFPRKKVGGWGGGQFKRWLKQEKASEEVREKKTLPPDVQERSKCPHIKRTNTTLQTTIPTKTNIAFQVRGHVQLHRHLQQHRNNP
jgi:hypothetical protein